MNKPLVELTFYSNLQYDNPFFDLELFVEVVHVDSQIKWKIPAFWDGDNIWKVRIYTPFKGEYKILSFATNEKDNGLHNVQHTFFTNESVFKHPLYKHGKLVTCKDRFIYEDGEDFFWFGDTWWMALSDRLPLEGFEVLLEDRKAKGFSVIQLVAGLFPDMDSFDERGKNEGGFAWEADYERINPEFFKYVDIKIEKIVDAGIVPFIFGAWGYYLLKMGKEKMQHHWRYLIARYSAYPVLWSVAGEVSMPWYLSQSRENEHEQLENGWDEIAKYIKKVDPYKRLLSAHPVEYSYKETKDSSIFDFEMLQAGHSDKESVKRASLMIQESKALYPQKPVVMDEISYEGILKKNKEDIQRMAFWISFICGADGFSYGANGIWQINRKNKAFGKSPSGDNWGETPWQDAMHLNGGKQIANSIAFLKRLPYQKFVYDTFFDISLKTPFCAHDKKEMKIIYSIEKNYLYRLWRVRLDELLSDRKYFLYHYDPIEDFLELLFVVSTDAQGIIKLPRIRFDKDWILLVSLKEISL